MVNILFQSGFNPVDSREALKVEWYLENTANQQSWWDLNKM